MLPLIIVPIFLDDNVWVAADAFVSMRITIGEGAIVGTRAAVFKDAEPWTVVGGNPAQTIKKRIIKEYADYQYRMPYKTYNCTINFNIMLNISVVILTYNEEMHIRRCLENVTSIARDIFIIDSFSTDRTLDIAKEYPNVHILQNRWENNYAKQFNWGLEHAPIWTKWILRLDADEYLLPELVEELQTKLSSLSEDVSGIIFNRRHIFMDKWMKRGIYPVKLLRVFQYGKGICEQRLMDEHIQLTEGHAVEFEHDFCDHNLNDLSWFCHKHVNYAIREAVDLLDIELNLTGVAGTDENKNISRQAQAKRMKKHKYVRQPLFWRSFAYFCYRYFLKGACLDGKVGFIWTFLQGWWYRTLVDAKVYEIKKTCGNDRQHIKAYLMNKYGIYI